VEEAAIMAMDMELGIFDQIVVGHILPLPLHLVRVVHHDLILLDLVLQHFPSITLALVLIPSPDLVHLLFPMLTHKLSRIMRCYKEEDRSYMMVIERV
jgi:hypothetical protein